MGVVIWEGPPDLNKWVDVAPSTPGTYLVTPTTTDCLGRKDSATHRFWAVDQLPWI